MGKNILVVDDSSMMRNMISGILSKAGHTIVGSAKNGIEGLAMYKTLKPELVTMDITMREMDGFTAAKKILEHDDAARIIFLSNLDKDFYKKDAVRAGAIGYVSKHDASMILDIIDSI